MEKKNGGKISHWQMHHLTIPDGYEGVFREKFPEVIYPPIMFTGTVVEDDPIRGWSAGFHMRSTYVISLDKKTGRCETMNTIYELDMKTEGQDSIFDPETGNKDLGNKVLNLFY